MERISRVASCWCIAAAAALLPAYAGIAAPAPDRTPLEACFRATEHSKENDHPKAIEQYTLCLSAEGLSDVLRAGVFIDRGNSYTKTGQAESAIQDFTQAVKLDPANSVAYNNRGNALKSQGRYGEALTDFSKALELAPMNTMIYNNRANTYKAMGKFDQAVADLDKAVELNPSNAISYYNRACLESVRRNMAAACDWLGRAIDRGFTEVELIRADRDLDNIRGSQCYERVLQKK